jgi:hypothetical protein
MSPLRRRLIEDMTIRKLAPKTQQGYIRTVKVFGPIARHGELRERTAFSTASDRERRTYAYSQSRRGCAAVLFRIPLRRKRDAPHFADVSKILGARNGHGTSP